MTRKSLNFMAVLALTACASQTEISTPSLGSHNSTMTLQDLNGSQIAMPVGLLLTSLDTDRDMRISRLEVLEGVTEGFAASDTDGNDYLSPIEFEAWSRTYLGSVNAMPYRLHFDRDQDAKVSLREFTVTFDDIRQRLDTNQDEALVRAELLIEIDGLGIDPIAMRAEVEAEMRRQMRGRIREVCRGGG